MPQKLKQLRSPTRELKNFTNRESELNALHRLLDFRTHPLPVIAFHGVGGTGKTWLLKHLREMARNFVPVAFLDLDIQTGGGKFHSDEAAVLAEIRRQFNDVPCPRFDMTFSWLRYQQGESDEPQFQGSGDMANIWEAASALGDDLWSIPGANFGKWLIEKIAGGSIKDKVKDSKAFEWLSTQTGQQEFLRLRSLTAQDIYDEDQLSSQLLLDLSEYLPKRDDKTCRGLIIIDTFEALRDTQRGEVKNAYREQWVQKLYREGSALGILVGGRDRLTWDLIDRDWSSLRFLEQHLVGGLSGSDARLFLSRCGIMEESMQSAALWVSRGDAVENRELTESGYHAQSLGLCVDIILAKNVQGKKAIPEKLRAAGPDKQKLAHLFMRSLNGSDQEAWIKRLANTPQFDEKAGRRAYSADPNSAATDAAWSDLIGYSFFRSAERDGWFTLHDTMMRALHEPIAYDIYWRDYWSRQTISSIDVYAQLSWIHEYRIVPATARNNWKVLATEARNEVRMNDHYELISWWSILEIQPQRCNWKVRANEVESLNVLANELLLASVGDRSKDLLRTVEFHEIALQIYTKEAYPQQWAWTNTALAKVYSKLPSGNRERNLQHAILCCKKSLGVFTESDFPVEWAEIQNILGLIYKDLPSGERRKNLRRAISHLERALPILTEEKYPVEWAETQNNLGIIYNNSVLEDRQRSMEQAIEYYTASLRVRTEVEFPVDWARTQNNLGTAYRNLPGGDTQQNIKLAISCYEAALRVRTEVSFPRGWAMIMNNMGVAFSHLKVGSVLQNLKRAIQCYEAALRVRTETNFPEGWAVTQNNLGTAYMNLPSGDIQLNIRMAIECYKQALRVSTETDFPRRWGMNQIDLGNAYRKITGHERRLNLELATECYNNALRRYSEKDFPIKHAMIKQYLVEVNSEIRVN